MATSTIRRTAKNLEIRSVTFPYSISSGSTASTNLKDLIDADLPSGSRFVGIAGYDVGSYNSAIITRLCYIDAENSLSVRNVGSSGSGSKTATIYYLCI